MDILRQLNTWKAIVGGETVNLGDEDTARLFIMKALDLAVPQEVKVFFSDKKDRI
jgi:hypothetical protein